MQRGTIVMIIGISIVILNWILSAVSNNAASSVKGMGYLSIGGWLVFFAGFGLKYLDKKKSTPNEPKRKKRS